ncbi:Cofilin/tropomyosin-type actin-binding protein [Spironucleus salmonicida]|uniref:Cofilin/tropomyosin-type actin-binding protein n=1 Tax=Spironucleus salmonicida TaxID=348837 RepID=V6LHY3_9EUKA|nr:Cofilin/tropomyosin-type actin-binding protein [Spironucleus salmonicida]|eukprot:EST43316.1 Cofilin/tropomyosin-type actin-binding protein [Spironucleus salmonicida]
MSGIQVHDDTVTVFDDLKLKKAYAGITLRMSEDNTKVIVDKTYPVDTTYDEILKDLPERDCRYLIYDVKYEKDGCSMSKLTLILWAPSTSPTKPKMLYAATKPAVQSKLTGIQEQVQATDFEEASLDEIISKFKK